MCDVYVRGITWESAMRGGRRRLRAGRVLYGRDGQGPHKQKGKAAKLDKKF